MNAGGWIRCRVLIAALFAISILIAGTGSRVAAQVVGNTYTSPNYGYTLTWSDRWAVYAEESNGGDFLGLTDGLTFVDVIGGPTFLANPADELRLTALRNSVMSNVEDFTDMTDAAGNPIKGGDETSAFGAYTFTLVLDDGTRLAMGFYIEIRPIVPGESSITIQVLTRIDYYWAELPFAQELLTGLVIPQVATAPEPVIGEPAPVFVTGPWRVGIAAAAQATEFPDAGLGPKSGKDWILVVVDVSNWSASPEEFNAREIRLTATGLEKPARPAPGSTLSVAGKMETTLLGDKLTMRIDPEESVRVILVYSVASDLTDASLLVGDLIMPLDAILDVALNKVDMPAIGLPADVARGEIVSASDGKTMRIQLEDETDSSRIQLLGIEPPAKGECYANEAEKMLDSLAGTRVLVEEDPNVTGGRTPQRYIWMVNSDGTRTLLNQDMIATGLVNVGEVSDEARFGLWLGQTATAAEAAGVGLWAGCETPEATETTAPTETPATNASPVADETDVAESAVPQVEIVLLDLAFEPTVIRITANTDTELILTNEDVVAHSFVIKGEVDSGSIAGGSSKTITVNLPVGVYAFQCGTTGHADAGMVGTLIVQAGT